MSIVSPFRSIENKHDVYRGKDCMKKFFEFLREHAMKKVSFFFKKKEIISKRAAGINLSSDLPLLILTIKKKQI